MIRFTCPVCNKRLKAPDEGVGRKTSCPRCGQRLLIPSPVRQQQTKLAQLTPPPSAPNGLEETPDAPAPALRVSGEPNYGLSLRNRVPKLQRGTAVGLLIVLFGLVGLLIVGLCWVGQQTNNERMAAETAVSHLDFDKAKSDLRAYLAKMADDPPSLTIDEWGKPYFVLIGKNGYEGRLLSLQLPADLLALHPEPKPHSRIQGYDQAVLLPVVWREKSPSGGRVRKEDRFLVTATSPPSVVSEKARARFAGEQLVAIPPFVFDSHGHVSSFYATAGVTDGKKASLVVVRGRLSQRRQPFAHGSGNVWVYWWKESPATEKDPGREGGVLHAEVELPRYEISELSPGRYGVVVEREKKDKTRFSVTVRDDQVIQEVNFDLDDQAQR